MSRLFPDVTVETRDETETRTFETRPRHGPSRRDIKNVSRDVTSLVNATLLCDIAFGWITCEVKFLPDALVSEAIHVSEQQGKKCH